MRSQISSRLVVQAESLQGLALVSEAALFECSQCLEIGVIPPAPPNFERDDIVSETYSVVMRRSHPLSAQKLTLKRYCSAVHLEVSITGKLYGIVDKALTQKSLTRQIVGSVPLFFPALATVARTDLLATIPVRLADAYAADFGLISVPAPFEIRPFTISAVWHRRSSADLALRWIRTSLHDFVSEIR